MSTVTAAPLANSGALTNFLTQQAATQAAAASSAAAANGTTSSSGTSSFSSLAGSETTFLKILTTQLQNQDPTSATDPNQFTEELVQFTQAEQQLDTNSKLDQLIALQQNSSGLSATLSYIGSYVEVPSTSQLPLQNGQAELAYTLPSAAASATVTIRDSSGNVVNTLTGPTASGVDRVAWNGMNSSDTQVPDGTYTYTLTALDASGNAITPTATNVVGLVTSVESGTNGATNLTLSTGMSVAASTVDAVYTSSSLPTGILGDPSTPSTSTTSTNSTTTPSS